MKTTLSCLALCLFFTACTPTDVTDTCAQTAQAEDKDGNTVGECPLPDTPVDGDGEVVVVPPVIPDVPVGPSVPAKASLFSASVTYSNFESADIDKVQQALGFIQKIIRTSEFRERILNHTYQGVKQFVDSNGLTNEQIYDKLLDGKETLLPVIDNQMDLQLELYANYSTSTVGYTYPNTTKIWMNRKFFDAYDPEEVSRNLFHEWTHKLGFGHDSAATSRRPYSVPYAVGKIIQDLAYKL